MKTSITVPASVSLLRAIAIPLSEAAEEFVQLAAEIYVDGWDGWSFRDNLDIRIPQERWSIFQSNYTFNCAVGANSWRIGQTNQSGSRTYWFTGTNFIDHIASNKRDSFTTSEESVDGNPGRPAGVADLMTFGAAGRICWLALCSGSALKHQGRRIYPPSDLWKESIVLQSGWSDKTTVSEDGLALPKSVTLQMTNGQTVVEYQVHQTTNVLGWTFPQEFYLVQYTPRGSTNNWRVELTAKGRVTSISVGT